MNESPVGLRAPRPDENLARRAELGVVAGYIHQLSRRHAGHAADAAPTAREARDALGLLASAKC